MVAPILVEVVAAIKATVAVCASIVADVKVGAGVGVGAVVGIVVQVSVVAALLAKIIIVSLNKTVRVPLNNSVLYSPSSRFARTSLSLLAVMSLSAALCSLSLVSRSRLS